MVSSILHIYLIFLSCLFLIFPSTIFLMEFKTASNTIHGIQSVRDWHTLEGVISLDISYVFQSSRTGHVGGISSCFVSTSHWSSLIDRDSRVLLNDGWNQYLIYIIFRSVYLKQIDLQIFLCQGGFNQDQQRTAVWCFSHEEPHASLHIPRERECFYGGEKKVGGWEGKSYGKQDSVAFHWLNPGQERSLSSSSWPLLQGMRALLSGLPLLLNWGFLFINFCIYHFRSRSFSESITDQESGFLI